MSNFASHRSVVLVTICLLVGCVHRQPGPAAHRGKSAPPRAASEAATPVAPVAAATLPKHRALAPPTGTMTSSGRPALRVTAGTEGIEICKTRACDAPQRVAVGADGRASFATDLPRGTWFWRVAAQAGKPAGPAWTILVRPSVGRASRVHGFDANGDGRADVLIDAAIVFGAAALAEEGTPVPYAALDAPPANIDPAAQRAKVDVRMVAVGDIDGDGFDDATLAGRLARGGPKGIRPESEWLACPPAGCGAPVGDINGDGYADLLREGTLQLGSPSGLRDLPAPLLAETREVRRAGDLNGDGIADLVALGKDRRTISVFRGGKAGVTVGATTMAVAPQDAEVTMDVGDIDGDGIADIVTSYNEELPGRGDSSIQRTTIVVRSTPPGGDIAHGTDRRVTSSIEADGNGVSAKLQIADANGDGFDDIVLVFGVQFGGSGRWIPGSAAGGRLETRPVAVRPGADVSLRALVSVGDLNGDGRDEIVVVGRPSVGGWIHLFEIHAGSKVGFAPKLLAAYNINEGDRVPERRLPPRPGKSQDDDSP